MVHILTRKYRAKHALCPSFTSINISSLLTFNFTLYVGSTNLTQRKPGVYFSEADLRVSHIIGLEK
jgi:hypothetical protein